MVVLECVVNISEGRDRRLIDEIAAAAGRSLLDVHVDADHHRSVLTLAGTDAPRAVARAACATLDLRDHAGVHPRIGVVDVVPFVPLVGSTPLEAVAARDSFARWAARDLGVPCFLYGPLGRHAPVDSHGDGGWQAWSASRTLPEVRRGAFGALQPDLGPDRPHPSAGAMAVGARPFLVAYNVWLDTDDLALARRIAAELRGPSVRALGLPVGGVVQVSMNLVDPEQVGPAAVVDAITRRAPVLRTELVGLVPRSVLEGTSQDRWAELDLAEDRTIEARTVR